MLDHSVEQEMCPIALASHLLGDKWIPIIIRDIALFDRRTFNDLLKNNLEKISSGSLTSRLLNKEKNDTSSLTLVAPTGPLK